MQARHKPAATTQTEWNQLAQVVPTIWIVVATMLSLTIVLTLGVSGGIKIYFRRQITHRNNIENYDDIIFKTHAVHIENPKNYVPTKSEVKSSPVFWKIVYPDVTQKENQQKNVYIHKTVRHRRFRTHSGKILRLISRIFYTSGRTDEDKRYSKIQLHPLR